MNRSSRPPRYKRRPATNLPDQPALARGLKTYLSLRASAHDRIAATARGSLVAMMGRLPPPNVDGYAARDWLDALHDDNYGSTMYVNLMSRVIAPTETKGPAPWMAVQRHLAATVGPAIRAMVRHEQDNQPLIVNRLNR